MASPQMIGMAKIKMATTTKKQSLPVTVYSPKGIVWYSGEFDGLLGGSSPLFQRSKPKPSMLPRLRAELESQKFATFYAQAGKALILEGLHGEKYGREYLPLTG